MRLSAGLSLALVLFLISTPAFASDDDPIAAMDRERRFVKQVFIDMDANMAEQAKSQQEDAEAIKKRDEEKRVAAQFAGLSETLSGLPEPPAFKGTFQTQTEDQRPPTKAETEKSSNG